MSHVHAPEGASSAPLLDIQNLQVRFRMGRDAAAGGAQRMQQAVGRDGRGVSFSVAANELVALVGESGSGKSVTAMSVLNLLPDNAERSGRVLWQGQDLLQASRARMQHLRGREIACIFQDPMQSLNPVMPVGAQLREPLQQHLGLSRRAADARALELFQEVGLPEPERRLRAYPHELSGGQQQRVMIAMALACAPKLLIADEPTTALDVTVQRQILELIGRLKRERQMSVLFITHDLGVVREIADRVVVMRHGEIREQGPVRQVFEQPQDAYTRALLACRPPLHNPPARLTVLSDVVAGADAAVSAPAVLAAAPAMPARDPSAEPPVVLEVRALAKTFWIPQGLFGKRAFPAVRDVHFQLRRGRTLGVVGESGSGKTTMGLTLLRLHEPTGGEVLFDGQDLLKLSADARLPMRRRIQIVFQNPYASLNPRFSIGQTLIEPMALHGIGADTAEREARARSLLQRVGLDDSAFGKYPHEFSGGQRQRIAIARCLTLSPEVLVLDEAVSALDVSVQAQVLNLLKDLQDELGLAYVFISHDLAVVRFISDDVLVMKDGQVVEQGPVRAVLEAPKEAYTQRLIASVSLEPGAR